MKSASPPPQNRIGPALIQAGLKLILAESCTGGLIASLVTDVPGASAYFAGGVVAYANQAKNQLLGVRIETLETRGAVSREVVLEMAGGARRLLESSFPPEQVVGLSVSGIAGPDGGTPEKPVGLAWIGLSGPYGSRALSVFGPGGRIENKIFTARQALFFLIEYLENH